MWIQLLAARSQQPHHNRMCNSAIVWTQWNIMLMCYKLCFIYGDRLRSISFFSFAHFRFEALGERSHQASHGNHIGIYIGMLGIRCAFSMEVEISFRPATANMWLSSNHRNFPTHSPLSFSLPLCVEKVFRYLSRKKGGCEREWLPENALMYDWIDYPHSHIPLLSQITEQCKYTENRVRLQRRSLIFMLIINFFNLKHYFHLGQEWAAVIGPGSGCGAYFWKDHWFSSEVKLLWKV